MRSTFSAASWLKSYWLLNGLLTRMPSTSTSVWSLGEPRKNTLVCEPGWPVFATSTPGWARRISATRCCCDCAICWRVMTVTELGELSCGVAMRVAVMVISSGAAAGALVPVSATVAGTRLVSDAPGSAGRTNRLARASERIFFKD